MAKSSRKVPPKFLKGKLIQNDKYTRHDSMGMAEDGIALNIDYAQADGTDPILNATEYLKAKKK